MFELWRLDDDASAEVLLKVGCGTYGSMISEQNILDHVYPDRRYYVCPESEFSHEVS